VSINNRDPTANPDPKRMNIIPVIGLIAVVHLLIERSGYVDITNWGINQECGPDKGVREIFLDSGSSIHIRII
jgi:hypothetical protein